MSNLGNSYGVEMTPDEFRVWRKEQEKKVAELIFEAHAAISQAKSRIVVLENQAIEQKSKKWTKFYAEMDSITYLLSNGLDLASDKINGRSR